MGLGPRPWGNKYTPVLSTALSCRALVLTDCESSVFIAPPRMNWSPQAFQIKAAAEAAFHRLRALHLEPLALWLASSLAVPAMSAELRAMAGVLLCKVMSPPPTSDSSNSAAAPLLWPQLSPAVRPAQAHHKEGLRCHLRARRHAAPGKRLAKAAPFLFTATKSPSDRG
jgi:hypothetical protein